MRANSKKKKHVLWGTRMLCLTAFLLFAGCGKKEIPIEDYVRSNPGTAGMTAIMKSDTGYYYSSTEYGDLNLHYYDVASGQNIYLCSKPECRHEGDAFCTATSEKYNVNSVCFYGGSLYLSVMETTESEYVYKLLRVSEDGSELTEVVTYLTVNKVSLRALIGGEEMIIHRGVAVIPYVLVSPEGTSIAGEISGITGTCIYNLVTGELTQLPELTYGTKSNGRERFTGCGDYIYFNTQQDRKNTLSRYCITDGSIEELELLRTYTGMYEVMDEDTIYYYYSGNRLFEHKISTKENITHEKVFTYMEKHWNPVLNVEMEAEENYTCTDMITDGTYLYAGHGVSFHGTLKGNLGTIVYSDGVEVKQPAYVHVYDKDLNEVVKVEVNAEPYLGYEDYFSVAILDGMVYLQTRPAVFACTLEEFLKGGQPPFELLYEHEGVEYLKYR